jgi:ribonuclease BN (tRNA processing enzyme)
MASDGSRTTATILGSGTCVPSLTRSACSVLVESDRDRILFDTGPGTMRRLLEAGVQIFDLPAVCYSHFHPDHSGELVPFIFANKYPDGSLRRRPLTLIGGRGFLNFYDGLRRVYGNWIELRDGLLKIAELDNTGFDERACGTFFLQSAPVEHNPESLAYRVTGADGRSVVYSGDTDYSENLIRLARNVDVLICEAALPDDLKVDGHLTPSLAGEIAARAGVGKLVLTHLYPECDTVDIQAQCRRTFSGPIVIASDLMRIPAGE